MTLTYNAHAKQSEFHRLVREYTDVLFGAGRGCGKTTAGALQTVMEAVEYQPGSRGIVCAPTYPMLEDATMFEFFRWLPRAFISDFNRSRRVLTLTNGSEIAFRSMDNADSLRGPNRTWAWLDEARNVRSREAYDIVSAQLRPTRKLWITTTPGGVYHWLYSMFFETDQPGVKVITARTTDNPYLPDEFAQRLRAQYTGVFAAQELDAEWVSFEGRIYDNFDRALNVTEDAEYDPAYPVTWGVDDGYAHGQGPGSADYHPRVALFGQWRNGELTIFAEYYRTLEPDYQQSIANLRAFEYPDPDIACVDSSATMFRAALSQAGIHNVGATHSVQEGIKHVRQLICDGNDVRRLKIHPRCVNLIREMQMYRYAERMASKGGEQFPEKTDDHGPDALRYLAWRFRL